MTLLLWLEDASIPAYPPPPPPPLRLPSTHKEITTWSLLRTKEIITRSLLRTKEIITRSLLQTPSKTQTLFQILQKCQTSTPSKFLLPPSSSILRRKFRRTFTIFAYDRISTRPFVPTSQKTLDPTLASLDHVTPHKTHSLKQTVRRVQRPLRLHSKVKRFLLSPSSHPPIILSAQEGPGRGRGSDISCS